MIGLIAAIKNSKIIFSYFIDVVILGHAGLDKKKK